MSNLHRLSSISWTPPSSPNTTCNLYLSFYYFLSWSLQNYWPFGVALFLDVLWRITSPITHPRLKLDCFIHPTPLSDPLLRLKSTSHWRKILMKQCGIRVRWLWDLNVFWICVTSEETLKKNINSKLNIWFSNRNAILFNKLGSQKQRPCISSLCSVFNRNRSFLGPMLVDNHGVIWPGIRS